MYVVRWKRSALGSLTQLWLDASDRAAVTGAVAEIERVLSKDPQEVGESRTGEIRILFVPPVGVFFEVEETSRTVNVLCIWTF